MNIFKTIIIGSILIVLVAIVILLIVVGLQYLMQYIPCELLVYVTTVLLIFLLFVIAYLMANPDAEA